MGYRFPSADQSLPRLMCPVGNGTPRKRVTKSRSSKERDARRNRIKRRSTGEARDSKERVRNIRERHECREGSGQKVNLPDPVPPAIRNVKRILHRNQTERIGELNVSREERKRKGYEIGKISNHLNCDSIAAADSTTSLSRPLASACSSAGVSVNAGRRLLRRSTELDSQNRAEDG